MTHFAADDSDLPEFPEPGANGNYPAVEFARVSLARKIIEHRRALGISQHVLARLAGVRQETISRLESGQHSPAVRTVDKIDQALKQAERRLTATAPKARSNSRKVGN